MRKKFHQPPVNPKLWITYSKGFRIGANEDKTELKLSWKSERSSFDSFYLKKPKEFANTPEQINRMVSIQFNPCNAPLHAVSLMFIDGKGEFFQIKKNIKVKPDKWNTVEVDAAKIATTKIHYGGNKDGKVDFPVRFLGFNFDIHKNIKPGEINIKL